MEYCTLREAIEKFPKLLDECVTWGQKDSDKHFLNSDQITFQFVGEQGLGYRTRILNKEV